MDILEFFRPLARQRRLEAKALLAGSAAQRVQRLQIGAFGLGCMILLVALADIVSRRAQETEASVVPAAAAPSVEEIEAPSRRDPLADAGVVPELPKELEAQVSREAQQDRDGPAGRD